MKPIPFNSSADFAPIPFTRTHLERAQEMKRQGLAWRPHVGCFVWDPEGCIAAESPFPIWVYFIRGRSMTAMGTVRTTRTRPPAPGLPGCGGETG